ncbi:MAG: hypothetical protein V1887_01645 [Candidatus Aenigmatarchaeota archaeon]
MDWKIAATLVVSVGILLGAFMTSGSIPAFSGMDISGVSGFFTALGSGPATNISVSISLTPQAFSIDSPAEKVTVEWVGKGSQWMVGNNRLDLADNLDNSFVIEGWKGKIIATTGGMVTLDGTADSLTVNGIRLSGSGGRQSVRVTDLSFTDFMAEKLSFSGFKLATATGTIVMDDGKATFSAEGEPLELGMFYGDLAIDSTLRLDGITDRLLLSGKNKLTVG